MIQPLAGSEVVPPTQPQLPPLPTDDLTPPLVPDTTNQVAPDAPRPLPEDLLPGAAPAFVQQEGGVPEIRYGIQRTRFGPPAGKVEEGKESTDLPEPALLFRRDSEKQVFQRMALEGPKKDGIKIVVPDELVLSKDKYVPRPLTGHWPRQVRTVAPSYVCHGRLFFEQPNFERHGWELSVFQPAVSLGIFYWDVLTLPYQCAAEPLRHYDCSAGKCLPGDPTPLLLYPPHLSLTGLTGEAAVILGGAFLFP